MTSTPGSDGPTGATTLRPPPDGSGTTVPRFARPVRWAHQATAALTLVCIGTALCLYVPGLAQLVGRRALVVDVHVWSGLLIPAPLLLGLGSRALRADVRLLNRFGPHDRRWVAAFLRTRRRPLAGDGTGASAGKFNAGQKLWAAWIAGAVLVMLGTGLLMWFTDLTSVVWRTSATFLHDWLALAIGVVLFGHVSMAVSHPEARAAMRTGRVDRAYARREHPLWQPEQEQEDDSTPVHRSTT